MSLFPALVFMLLSSPAQAEERELLRCTRDPHYLGAPIYSLTIEERSGRASRYYLKWTPLNPTVPPTRLEISQPVRYGDTWIATKDLGRSGYAHLYARGPTTLIDIDLFQKNYRGMNTVGPLLDYSCKSSP